MNPVDLRSALHKYIDTADEQRLEALYLLLGDQIAGSVHKYDDRTIAEFHRRRSAYLAGEAPTIKASDSIARIRGGEQ